MRPFLLRIVYFDLLLLALPLGDAQGTGNVAGDVQAGTAHVEQTVHSHDQANVSHGDADGFQHHGQHDHTGAGSTGSADGGQRSGDHNEDHLAQGQLHTGTGGQEHSGNTLIDGGAVHVDGGAQRQHEGGNIVLSAQSIGALLGDRQGRGGGGGGEGIGDCIQCECLPGRGVGQDNFGRGEGRSGLRRSVVCDGTGNAGGLFEGNG